MKYNEIFENSSGVFYDTIVELGGKVGPVYIIGDYENSSDVRDRPHTVILGTYIHPSTGVRTGYGLKLDDLNVSEYLLLMTALADIQEHPHDMEEYYDLLANHRDRRIRDITKEEYRTYNIDLANDTKAVDIPTYTKLRLKDVDTKQAAAISNSLPPHDDHEDHDHGQEEEQEFNQEMAKSREQKVVDNVRDIQKDIEEPTDLENKLDKISNEAPEEIQ